MRTVINAIFYDNQGKILVVDKPGIDKTILPGGKQDPGESDEQTLTRECKEELGVEVSVGEFLGEIIGKSPTSQIETSVKFYAVKLLGKLETIATTAEVRNARFLSPEEIISHEKTSDLTRAAILKLIEPNETT